MSTPHFLYLYVSLLYSLSLFGPRCPFRLSHVIVLCDVTVYSVYQEYRKSGGSDVEGWSSSELTLTHP